MMAGAHCTIEQIPGMEKSNHLEVLRRDRELDAATEVKHIVENNEAGLTGVERTVIYHRFGLAGDSETAALTLEQVGQIIGVTKERVRQIQNKALDKIRLAVEEKARRRGEGDEDGDGPNGAPTKN